MSYKVGCVPYVNAVPLVLGFEELGDASPVQVVYEVPSRLPDLLDRGEIDAMLVSSFDPLTTPGRVVVPGIGIGSYGRVDSVRLFSRVPFSEIRTLVQDLSSMTSNALARIILAEAYGVHPALSVAMPNLEEMLSKADACILIGDIGMDADGSGFFVLDLGEAWTDLTGLPFVWAVWAGNNGLTTELSNLLAKCPTLAVNGDPDILDRCVRAASFRVSWSEDRISNYLQQTIRYQTGHQGQAAMAAFGEKLRQHNLVPGRQALTVS